MASWTGSRRALVALGCVAFGGGCEPPVGVGEPPVGEVEPTATMGLDATAAEGGGWRWLPSPGSGDDPDPSRGSPDRVDPASERGRPFVSRNENPVFESQEYRKPKI